MIFVVIEMFDDERIPNIAGHIEAASERQAANAMRLSLEGIYSLDEIRMDDMWATVRDGEITYTVMPIGPRWESR